MGESTQRSFYKRRLRKLHRRQRHGCAEIYQFKFHEAERGDGGILGLPPRLRAWKRVRSRSFEALLKARNV